MGDLAIQDGVCSSKDRLGAMGKDPAPTAYIFSVPPFYLCGPRKFRVWQRECPVLSLLALLFPSLLFVFL